MQESISTRLAKTANTFLPDSPLYWGLLLFLIKQEFALIDLMQIPEFLDNILTGCALLLLLFYAVRKWTSPKEILLCAVGLGIIGLAAVRIRNFHLLITAVTVLAMRNQDIKKALRFIFNWKFLFFVFFFILAIVQDALGLRSIWMNIGNRGSIFLVSGHALRLGYRHYTAPGGVFFSLTQLWCYLHFGSIQKKHAVILVLTSLVLFELTTARMSLVMTLFLLCLVLFYQARMEKKNPLLHLGAAFSAPALFVFFLILLCACRSWSPLVWKLNKLLSNRLAEPAVWYYYRGLSWLGNSINGVTLDPSVFHITVYTHLDCLYTGMAVWEGILPFLVIVLCIYLLARKKMVPENVMLLSWAVASIAESSGLNCYSSFPLLLTAMAIPKTEQKPDAQN